MMWAANLILQSKINIKTLIGRRLFLYAIMCALILFFISVSGDWRGWAKWAIFWLIVYVFFDFVFPLFTQGKVKGYSKKWEAQESIEDYYYDYSLFGRFVNKFGRNALITAVTLFLLLQFSYLVGKGSAKKEADFLVIKGQQNKKTLVVLKTYSDRLICAPLIEGQKKIKPQLHILLLSPKEIILEPAKIGPLTLEEPPAEKK